VLDPGVDRRHLAIAAATSGNSFAMAESTATLKLSPRSIAHM
jgi:hypothetical protein